MVMVTPEKAKRRNVTISLPEDLLRRARVAAAEQDRSLTSLVEQQLEKLLNDADDYHRLWNKVFEDMQHDSGMRIGEKTWTRDDLHDRSL